MKAAARLEIASADGHGYIDDVFAEPPLAIRRAGRRFLVVGAAAAPVRGDELALALTVAPGATADVGTVAATITWPGPPGFPLGPPSSMLTSIDVGAGAHVDWRPQSTVSVAGSDHVTVTRVELASGATCRIIEEFSLGRSGEPSGHLETRLRVTRHGVPVLDHGERFGPDVAGAGSLARAGAIRHVLAAVIVGPAAEAADVAFDVAGVSAARLPRASDVAVFLAAGPDRPSVLGAWRRLLTPDRSGAGT